MRNIFVALLILIACQLKAQTTLVPDTNFLNFLKKAYPTVIDSNNRIIDSRAANIGGLLNCSNLKIKDLSGIQKFTKLTRVFCSDNQIQTLDSLYSMVNLTHIDCHNNPLTAMTDLSRFKKLLYLWCSGCNLTQDLDLSNNPDISTLNCYYNKIPNIIGFEKLFNLQYLNCFNNNLSKPLDLSPHKKLILIQCFGNPIGEILGLDSLFLLQTIEAGNCALTSFPDVSNLKQLKTLKVYSNRLQSFPELIQNSELTVADFSYNRLTQFPELGTKTKLQRLYLNFNNLKEIPNLDSCVNLVDFRCQGNQLTFEDLQPLAINKFTTFQYAPQADISNYATFKIRLNEKFTYQNQLLGTNYKWYKNKQLKDSSSTDQLLISRVGATDSAKYNCVIQHNAFPLLKLNTTGFKLEILECMNLDSLKAKYSQYICNQGYQLSFNPEVIVGGRKPFQYVLTSKQDLSNSISSFLPMFSNQFDPAFTLTVVDSFSCQISKEFNLSLLKLPDCQDYVIVFDGTQSNPVYFAETGVAKVYNKSGQQVYSFSAPFLWDGTLTAGQILPGYYVVDLNNKKYNVTVIK